MLVVNEKKKSLVSFQILMVIRKTFMLTANLETEYFFCCFIIAEKATAVWIHYNVFGLAFG